MEEQRVRRRGFAVTLVVLASIAAFLAIFSLWANRQLLNTENWTTTSSKLLAKPMVRDRVAGFLVDQLYENVDVAGELQAALPDRAKLLAGPAAGALRPLAERGANALLPRPGGRPAAWGRSASGAPTDLWLGPAARKGGEAPIARPTSCCCGYSTVGA